MVGGRAARDQECAGGEQSGVNAAWVVMACLAGAGLVAVGLRGRREGSRPSCAACGYDVGEVQALRCPECGQRLGRPGAVAIGVHRRRWALVSIGGCVLAMTLLNAALEARGVWTGAFITGLKPAGWLLREIGPVVSAESWPDRADSLAEFRKRLRSGRVAERHVAGYLDLLLPSSPRAEPAAPSRWVEAVALAAADPGVQGDNRDRVVEWLLARQADSAASWDGDWGDAIIRLRNQGELSHQAWMRFLESVAAPRLRLDDGSRSCGDTVRVSLSMGWRGGKTAAHDARVEVSLEGGDAPVYVRSACFVAEARSPSILWDRLASSFGGEPVAILTLPDEVGEHTLRGSVRITVPVDSPGDDAAMPVEGAVSRTHEVGVSYYAAKSTLRETEIVIDETLRARIEACVRGVGQPRAARGPWGIIARGSLEIVQPPMDLAFDIIWRESDQAVNHMPESTGDRGDPPREWRVGWLLIERDHGAFSETYESRLDGFDAKAVQVVLRPNLGVLRRHARVREVWGGEIVAPTRMVRWEP